VIPESSVAIVVKTHSKVDIATIEIDNQIAIIQIQVRKNIVEDVLIDGRENVNIITKSLRTKLGLSKPRPAPYHLKIIDQNMTKTLRIIGNLNIHTHGIPYIATFTVLKNNVVDFNYFMLLGRP
jgi:hypothetical protein